MREFRASGPARGSGPRGRHLHEAQPAHGAPGLAKLRTEPADLRSHDRVVQLDQQGARPHPLPFVHVESRDHARFERLHPACPLPGDDLAAGRSDDVHLGDPRKRARTHEQQGKDGDYAHRARRCGGSQRDHMAL